MLQQATSHKVVVTGFCSTTGEEDQASLEGCFVLEGRLPENHVSKVGTKFVIQARLSRKMRSAERTKCNTAIITVPTYTQPGFQQGCSHA